jgi:FkbM family methyltransferase
VKPPREYADFDYPAACFVEIRVDSGDSKVTGETSLLKQMSRSAVKHLLHCLPRDSARSRLRAALLKSKDSLHESLLCEPGETVLMIGVHRIDTAMNWSAACGPSGRVVLVEAMPRYLENIRANLEEHLNWPLRNLIYVPCGVSSAKSIGSIQVGLKADFNRIAERGIEDGLGSEAVSESVTVQLNTVDSILEEYKITHVDHITMTISEMEMDALQGMQNTLGIKGLRLLVRSLHTIDGRPQYLRVQQMLQKREFRVVLGPRVTESGGRNIYAFRA